MSESGSSCAVSLDVADHHGIRGDEAGVREGSWRCPHDAPGGFEKCVFHLPPGDVPADVDVHEVFISAVATPGRRTKQFLGADLDRLWVEHEVLDAATDNYPIDLRYADVAGDLALERSHVRQPFRIGGATVGGEVTFRRTRFEDVVQGSAVDVAGDVSLKDATFEDDVRFNDVCIGGDLSGWSAGFAGPLQLESATVEGVAKFNYADFDDVAVFTKATFESSAFFTECRFRRNATFYRTAFAGNVGFEGATFEDDATFRNVQFDADAETDFTGARAEAALDFEHSHLPRGLSFARATIDGPAIFDDLHGPSTVDFENATVRSGRLVAASDGEVTVDLTGATVGDVALSDETGSPSLSHLVVDRTTFDGFDVPAHRSGFDDLDWDVYEKTDGDVTSKNAETTYLKLRLAADESGDQSAAGKFFRRELFARRDIHRHKMAIASGAEAAAAGVAWAKNWGFGLVAGHGELPGRVIGVSVATILAFAGVFGLVLPSGVSYGGALGPLVLSLESFITLVLAGGPAVPDPAVRLLAEVEGFVGAFLIALFVFTLTRSIRR